MNATSLSEHVVVVTGASRGLGHAAAQLLATRGARVALLARDPARIEGLAREIRARGREAISCPCDITSVEAVTQAFAHIRERLGPATGLLNNAGSIGPIGTLHETDPAAWAAGIATNLTGAYHVLRAALPDFLAAGRGVVINMSSGAASQPNEGWSSYCAGKAGLMMLTRMIDLEYRSSGVSAYGLRPGLIDTDMQAEIRASGINAISRIPRDSLVSPQVPAAAAAWLIANAPETLRGEEVDIRQETFRRLSGLDDSGSVT